MHILDNPIWAALSTRHQAFAHAGVGALRYPRDIAPFLAIQDARLIDAADLSALVAADETVFLVGPRPEVPDGWLVEALGCMAQMVCERRVVEPPGPVIVPLGSDHRDSVLALTAIVYPHYFRTQTMALGRYFGIFEEGQLAAIIGERMAMPGFREVSAVCTAPGFTGRGLARRLVTWLSNDNLARGETPFLHVSPRNERAKRLYEENGYRTRSELPFWSIRRSSDATGAEP